MNIILFDTAREHGNLLPLTFTRPVADLRLGIDTLREKWEALLPGDYSYLTAPYLSEKYPSHITSDNIYIAGHLIATPQWAEQIASLQPGEAIADADTGLCITRARLGNVTFWVKYQETEDGYLVFSAYSHRMNVVNRQ